MLSNGLELRELSCATATWHVCLSVCLSVRACEAQWENCITRVALLALSNRLSCVWSSLPNDHHSLGRPLTPVCVGLVFGQWKAAITKLSLGHLRSCLAARLRHTTIPNTQTE